MQLSPYTKQYYELIRDGALRSADVLVPLVLALVPARSVVDIGCGDGTWLSVFRKAGVADVLGLDGQYVGEGLLQIPRESFQAVDLKKPLSLSRSFDLAVSLEVAEHLPAACAASFVESLTRLAPAILFSAAIPYQGGNHHINEQWPENWAELFRKHGYLAIDCVRKRVWDNEAVEWWYAQNTILFARAELIESNRDLKVEFEQTNLGQLSLVHPRNFLDTVRAARPAPAKVFEALRLLILALRNSFRWRTRFLSNKGSNTDRVSKPSEPGA
jgi:SAM-dependent methyltransferase